MRFIRLKLILIFLSLPAVVSADPKKGGGFFNKEELDRGFFAEPTPSPTEALEPIPTAKPVSATAAPTIEPTAARVSNADIAREIVKGGADSIERIKAMQADPNKKDQILQSLQGVRDNISSQTNSKLPITVTPDPRPTPLSIVPPENLLNDYKPEDIPANIIVVVKAEPRTTFLRTLDRVYVAASKLRVTVSKILVIGMNRDLEQYIPNREENLERLNQTLLISNIPPSARHAALNGVQEAIPNTQLLLEKLHFIRTDSGNSAKSIIKTYSLQSSPAWIIDAKGKTTIIQGEIDPREFLTENGQINPELRENELGGSPFGAMKRPDENCVTEFQYLPPPTPVPAVKKVLPVCTRARIRRLQVGPATFGAMFSPDLLIYTPEDPEQLKQSESYGGTSVAYNPMHTEAQAKSADSFLPFLLSQPLRCLPTRMHTVNVGGRQYIEFRQGEAAWRE